MKKAYIFSILLSTLSILSVSADSYQDGALLNRSSVSIADLANMSNVNYGFSTARSSAMAGAFTSLGADLASININPAGLGMYKSSDVSFSYSYNSVNANQSVANGWYDNTKASQGSVNNFGIVYNLFKSDTKSVSSFSLGISYNKAADFSSSYGIGTEDDYNSISQVFAKQIAGLDTETLKSDADAFKNYNSYLWGGILGYQTFASDYSQNTSLTSHYLKTVTNGGINEYSISTGISIKDFLYFGASVSLQNYTYSQTMYYDESYEAGTTDRDYLLYDQNMTLKGSGVNFKLGVTAMPFDNLRIGLAYHSSTKVSLSAYYQASMTASYDEYTDIYSNSSDIGTDIIDYTTPSRFLAGISYVFSNRFILAFDYERVFYNNMTSDVSTSFSEQFKASNNIKIGLEYLINDKFSLRAGYANYGKTILSDDMVLAQPTAYTGYNISAGLGYRIGNVYIDLTYILMNTTYSSFDLYYYEDDSDVFTTPENYITYSTLSNVITATVGYKF